jgi:hypothetical protein
MRHDALTGGCGGHQHAGPTRCRPGPAMSVRVARSRIPRTNGRAATGLPRGSRRAAACRAGSSTCADCARGPPRRASPASPLASLSSRPSHASATRSICSSSDRESISEVSSSTTGSSAWSSSTAASLSSDGFDPGSGSVTSSLASSSRALTMMKQTYSGEMASSRSVSMGRTVDLDVSGIGSPVGLTCRWEGDAPCGAGMSQRTVGAAGRSPPETLAGVVSRPRPAIHARLWQPPLRL